MSLKVQVIAKGNYFFHYGERLAYEFEVAGHTAHFFSDDTYEVTQPWGPMDLNVVVGPNVYNHEYVAKLTGRKIAILTEQLPHLDAPVSNFVIDRIQQFDRHRDLYDGYIEWSSECHRYLERRNPSLRVHHFTHGYVPWRDEHVKTEDCEWDVCFLGAMSPRRELVMRNIMDLGLSVFPKHEDVWGDEKLDALKRSRIILNMHFDHAPRSFEAHRIFQATATGGRPIFSERMNDSSELAEIIPQCDYQSLPRFTKIMSTSDNLDEIGLAIRDCAKQYSMQDLVAEIMLMA